MQRYGATVLMAAILLGLAAYLYFIEFPTQERQERRDAEESKLLPLEESAVTHLAIRSEQGDIVLDRASDGGWKMTVPIKTEADRREVESMIRALVLGKVSRTVEESASALAPFGLDKPAAVITIGDSNKHETFSIGDTGPISSTLYVLRDSDHHVLLTDLAAKDFLNKSVMSFRRKEILQIDQAQVDRLRLHYPPTELVLYLMPEKPAKKWKIRAPIETNADQSEVRAFLYRLADLKAIGIIDPGPERTTTEKKLTNPVATITVHTAGRDQVVKLYQPDPASGEAFAVTPGHESLYRISPNDIKDLTKDLFTLRDKRLLGMDLLDISMLHVKTREHDYTLINQHDEWVLEDQPMAKLKQEDADLFVSRVVNLPAELREVKQPGALAPYGLAAPAAEFTATRKDGRTARLVLGNHANGLVYAKGHGLTGIYRARSDILTQIPSKESLLKSATEDDSDSQDPTK
ncbi:hypothetical protein YTPLAS18_12320 [Nitrospira sp.]|nr:hypothetical protein YTPLAS18_12320 [Nitrospira sp.]